MGIKVSESCEERLSKPVAEIGPLEEERMQIFLLKRAQLIGFME